MRVYLAQQCGIDVELLDVTARGMYERSHIVSAERTWRCYEEVKSDLETRQDLALADLRAPRLKVSESAVTIIRSAYEEYCSTVNVGHRERARFENLFNLLLAHAPQSLELSDLEALQKNGLNPRPLHTLVTSIPPEIVSQVCGDLSKNLLLWAAVNFSSATSTHHHTSVAKQALDVHYKRVSEFLAERYDLNLPHFQQAQVTVWKLCSGSVDLALVLKNYELFERMRSFDYSAISLPKIFREYPVKHVPRNPERYGVCPLEVIPEKVEGADIHWVERQEPWDWSMQDKKWIKNISRERSQRNLEPIDENYNWRGFGQTVRCDAPRALALTYNGYPAAIVSFYVAPDEDGVHEVRCTAMQGVRIELWRGNSFQTFSTPPYLPTNYLQILTEMVIPLADVIGARWSHQGAWQSEWRDKVSVARLERRLHDLEIRGVRLAIDIQGNWSLPRG